MNKRLNDKAIDYLWRNFAITIVILCPLSMHIENCLQKANTTQKVTNM